MAFDNDLLDEKQEKPVKLGFEEMEDINVVPHEHTGIDAEKIDPKNFKNAFFKVVTSAPSSAPNSFLEQIQIYGDLLYVWDNTNETWKRFNYNIA